MAISVETWDNMKQNYIISGYENAVAVELMAEAKPFCMKSVDTWVC